MTPELLDNASRQIQRKRDADLERARARGPIPSPGDKPAQVPGEKPANDVDRVEDAAGSRQASSPRSLLTEALHAASPHRPRSLLTEALRAPEGSASATASEGLAGRMTRAERIAQAEALRRMAEQLRAESEAKLRAAEALLASGICSPQPSPRTATRSAAPPDVSYQLSYP